VASNYSRERLLDDIKGLYKQLLEGRAIQVEVHSSGNSLKSGI